MWLTNSNLSGINLASKYIELFCDVILNDEKFDENGTPSGGDGIVYSWQRVECWTMTELEGNNHTIYGMYFNDETASNFSMFYSVSTIENLTTEKSFIKGKSSLSCLSIYCSNLINVHTKNGNIIGEYSISGIILNTTNICENVSNGNNITQLETTTNGGISGICGAVNKTFKDCANYGNIYLTKVNYAGGLVCRGGGENLKNYGTITRTGSATGVGGIAGYSDGTFINCENYGEVNGGGIVGYNYGTTVYKNCKNYANLTNASGIASWGHSAEFYDCVNYGNIINENPNSQVGGILGSANQSENGTVIFKNCKNFGNIENGSAIVRSLYYYSIEMVGCENYGNASYINYHGDLIGQIVYINNVDKNIIIKDCYNAGGKAILGRMSALNQNNKNITLLVDNVKMDILQEKENQGFITEISGMLSVEVSNIFINCEKKVKNLRLFWNLGYEIEDFKVKNILFYGQQCENSNFVYNFIYSGGFNKEKINLSNFVVQNDGGQSCYYGDDFAEYYVDWKSGKIGLKVFDGKGFYQGKVSEEVLQNKDYIKREVV